MDFLILGGQKLSLANAQVLTYIFSRKSETIFLKTVFNLCMCDIILRTL